MIMFNKKELDVRVLHLDNVNPIIFDLYQLMQINLFLQTVFIRSICYGEFLTGSNSQHQAWSKCFFDITPGCCT